MTITSQETYNDGRAGLSERHIQVVDCHDLSSEHAVHIWTGSTDGSLVLSAADARRLRDQLTDLLSRIPARPFLPGDQVYPSKHNREVYILRQKVPDATGLPGAPADAEAWIATRDATGRLAVVFLSEERSVHAERR